MKENKIFFSKNVDMTNRNTMINFLKNHARYDTMNSWNASTSYANNVKIYNLGIKNKELEDKIWDILYSEIDCDAIYDDFNIIIREFEKEFGYGIGFNGRSRGYLVLYEAEYDEHKNSIKIYPGKSIDMNEDFEDNEEWPMEKLQERCKLVCAFDKACDDIRNTLLYWGENASIVETEQVITQKTKTLILP